MTQSSWSLDSLNKAYQQGYMIGLANNKNANPYTEEEVLFAAWDAGYSDGFEQFAQRQTTKPANISNIA